MGTKVSVALCQGRGFAVKRIGDDTYLQTDGRSWGPLAGALVRTLAPWEPGVVTEDGLVVVAASVVVVLGDGREG